MMSQRNTTQSVVKLLSTCLRLFEKRGDRGLNYAQALDTYVLLSRAHSNGFGGGRDLKRAAKDALQICESQGPDSSAMALALETEANLSRGDDRAALLARAFSIRAERVAVTSSEVPQALAGPIPDPKSSDYDRPTLLKKVEPQYPALALRARLECKAVLLSIVTDSAGVAGKFELKKSCGFGFDERAAETVTQWRFHPATDKAGHPVPYLATVEIRFRLAY